MLVHRHSLVGEGRQDFTSEDLEEEGVVLRVGASVVINSAQEGRSGVSHSIVSVELRLLPQPDEEHGLSR